MFSGVAAFRRLLTACWWAKGSISRTKEPAVSTTGKEGGSLCHCMLLYQLHTAWAGMHVWGMSQDFGLFPS